MKQILIATDFSASAANAMSYGMELAKVLDIEVCVIHAIHPTEGIDNNTYNAIFIEDYYNNKREALKEWVSTYINNDEYKAIEVTTLCAVGFLKTVISRYADENQVEFLVMGITGSTGIKGIVGSNVSAIVTKVKIPTLVIPLESTFPKMPGITIATDYETRFSAPDVNALNEMVKAFGSEKVEVLYVLEKANDRYLEIREKHLKDLIKHTELNFNYITDTRPLNGIIEFVEAHNTDLLCLVKHHHNIVYRLFNRSTVNQVMNKSVKAILVLHE